MIGDSLLRSAKFSDLVVAIFYCILGVVMSLIILGIALTTSSYTQIDFPTGNDGMYGFVMKSVQTRVPLSNAGGSTVSPPPYNADYTTFGVSAGAPINPTAY